MSEEPAGEKNGVRPRRMYVLWGLAFLFLGVTTFSCWMVAGPIAEIREAVESCAPEGVSVGGVMPSLEKSIERLGGPERAAGRLGLYLRLPEFLAPHRETAVRMLGSCGEAAVQELIGLLGNGDVQVRMDAVESLSQLADPRAVEPLIEVMKSDRDGDVRRVAADTLAEFRDQRTVEPFIAGLRNGYVCRTAIEALGKLKDPRAVEPLIAVLENPPEEIEVAAGGLLAPPPVGEEEDRCLRRLAMRSLGQIGDARALGPLLKVFGENTDPVNRKWAARAIGGIADEHAVTVLAAALKDPDQQVRSAAATALGRFDKVSPETLVAALVVGGESNDIRLRIAIENVGAPALPHLAAGMKKGDDGARFRMVLALKRIKSPRAVDLLIVALGDRYYRVRAAAVAALAESEDTRAVDPLIAMLSDGQQGVREAAILALAKFRSSRAVKPLCSKLGDGSVSVRRRAATALKYLKAPAAFDPLCAALRDTDEEVRRSAAEGLGRLKDRRALLPLIGALKDKQWGVRLAAANALGEIGDAGAVGPLIAALQDEHSLVRLRAAHVLGLIKDRRALEPLKKVLNDKDAFVRQEAWEAVKKILRAKKGGARATPG